MTDFLYEKFLIDRAVYRANCAYWGKVFRKISIENELESGTYIVNRFNNKKLIYDGNPIYSLYSYRTKKALRIVQEDPSEFGAYYYSSTAKTTFSGSSIAERLIVLTLNHENLQRAKDEATEWLKS